MKYRPEPEQGPEGGSGVSVTDAYRRFEALAGTNPDDAWNIAYTAGQQHPEPTRFVSMERLRETVLGMLGILKHD